MQKANSFLNLPWLPYPNIYIGAPQVVKKQSEKSMHTHNMAMLVSAALAACYQ